MIFVLTIIKKCKQHCKNENHWSLLITRYSLLGIQTPQSQALTISFQVSLPLLGLLLNLITRPARRGWRSFKFAPFLFFSESKFELPLMGDTAVHTAVGARVTTAFELNFWQIMSIKHTI